jgi:glycosyltransferase involved in cell wall biosynthesis
MTLHIGIAGPISTESIEQYLNVEASTLPVGYKGAPLLGTLIGELLSRGHKVSVYTTSNDISPDLPSPVIAEGDNFKIYYCPSRKHSIRMNGRHLGRIIDFFRRERLYLGQAINLDNPDVVHAHWAYEFALATIKSGKPHIVTCHDAPQTILKYMPNLYRLGRYFMAIKAMRTANKLTTVSSYMFDSLTTLTSNKIEVVPNPIPWTVVQHPFDKKRKLERGKPVVIMVINGWDDRKNPKIALQAFAKIRLTLCGARLRLFGSGFEENGIAWQWAQQQGLDSGVEFLGCLPYESLMDEVAKADIFLHSSLEESFGMVLAEAMALGVPVIAGKNSGAVPWVVGSGGILVDVTSAEKISDALHSILTDEAKWLELRHEASLSSKQRFAPNKVADAYEALYYQQLVGEGE